MIQDVMFHSILIENVGVNRQLDRLCKIIVAPVIAFCHFHVLGQ